MVKKIIGGRTYNTDTAAFLCGTQTQMRDPERGKVAVDFELHETRADMHGLGLFLVRTETWTTGKRKQTRQEVTPVDSMGHARELLGPLSHCDWRDLMGDKEDPLSFCRDMTLALRRVDKNAKKLGIPGYTISVRLPPNFAKLIKTQAKKDEMSVNQFIVRACERFLQARGAHAPD
jgi:hypothetical protein